MHRPEIDDLLFFCGSSAVTIGLGMVYLPLGIIFAGLCLFGLGLLVGE